MLYELREYHVAPGRMEALNDRFANIGLGYFAKHGIEVIGFWTDVIGTTNRLTYMLRWEDMAHRERGWGQFAADEARLAEFKETEPDGPLVTLINNRLLAPTDYSPMQ